MKDVRVVNVPSYDELSVKALYPQVIADSDLAMHLPDVTSPSRLPERRFFFNVLNTIHAGYVEELVKQAKSIRFATVKE